MCIINEEQLFRWIFLQAWQSFVNIRITFCPFFVRLPISIVQNQWTVKDSEKSNDNCHKPHMINVVNRDQLTKYDSRRPPLSAISSPCVWLPFDWSIESKQVIHWLIWLIRMSIIYLHIDLCRCIITILFDNACFTFDEFLDCFFTPPWNTVAIFIKLSTGIIEAVCYFMSNNDTNSYSVSMWNDSHFW
jgi:hypothetical protein